MMVPDQGAFYSLTFELRQFSNTAVYVVADFDNPDDKSIPLRTELTVQPRTLEFNVRSPPIHVLTANKQYSVHLSLYGDALHTQLIGKHHQTIVFDVPPQLQSQWESAFNIRIL